MSVKRGLLLFVFSVQCALAQQPVVSRVEPPNWWAGMKHNQVQVMMYGEGLSQATVTCSSPDVRIKGTHSTGNPSYLFVDIELTPATHPGDLLFQVVTPAGRTSVSYPIAARENPEGRYRGFTCADVVYLITPDRFSDGDPSNNSVAGMREEKCDRNNPYGRHGGDIQGILNHLDYLADLGVTALWINPLIENDNPGQSYHGYAAIDLYKIDARFGTNELYACLVEAAHRRGLKIIMDHVSNHISIHHPWLRNLPANDWLNGSVASHDRTRHYKSELTDPYADSSIVKNLKEGWFADYMPDLNYYGTEIAMRGGRDHGTIRSDFPGGFPGDQRNAFASTGRTAEQDSMFQYVRSLLHARKEHPALTQGTLAQLPPTDGIYAYARSFDKEKIIVLANNNSEVKKVKLSQLRSLLGNAGALRGLLNGKRLLLKDVPELEIPGNSAEVYLVQGP
jgi:glycosidase